LDVVRKLNGCCVLGIHHLGSLLKVSIKESGGLY
jgi:hypothetical protein